MSEIQAKYWTTIACDSRKAGAPTMEDKILRTINTICIIFPPFPLSPKQCCSLCPPVHFTLS